MEEATSSPDDQTITVGRELSDEGRGEGGPFRLDLNRILPGRAAIFGKSGSGKSNSIGVICERLLEANLSFLIVDADDEHHTVKEMGEVVRVGATEGCDYRLPAEEISREVADALASLVLEENVPIVLNVASYIDRDDIRELIRVVGRAMFDHQMDSDDPAPRPLIVEEAHEYLPQSGATDDCATMLKTIGKRGRKHGLGLWIASQRPANVDKDFVTQADWLLWHKLTWEHDTKVVRRVVGKQYADKIETMDKGEAFVQLDWAEADVLRVQMAQKETFDAGATPTLGDRDRPEFEAIDSDVLSGLEDAAQKAGTRRSEIDRLEGRIEELKREKEDLQAELEKERERNAVAEQVGGAASEAFGDLLSGEGDKAQTKIEAEVAEIREEKAEAVEEAHRLRDRVDELEAHLQAKQERIDELEQYEDLANEVDVDQVREALDVLQSNLPGIETENDERVAELRKKLRSKEDRIEELEAARVESQDSTATDPDAVDPDDADLNSLLNHRATVAKIDTAVEMSDYARENFDKVLGVLEVNGGEPASASEIANVLPISETTARAVCQSLDTAGVVETEGSRPTEFRVDEATLRQGIKAAQNAAAASAGNGAA